jgi:hypothetical protein
MKQHGCGGRGVLAFDEHAASRAATARAPCNHIRIRTVLFTLRPKDVSRNVQSVIHYYACLT